MMDTMTTDELVRTIGGIPDQMGASACFGTPVEREGHTLIPVARVAFGYGLGFGRGAGTAPEPSGNGHGAQGGEGEGGGGGGGGSSAPVAVIDLSRDGVEIRPIEDRTRIALSGIALSAWAAFWFFLTVRTVARELGKVRRHAIDKGAA